MTQPRRLPEPATGRTAIYLPEGRVATMVNSREEAILKRAEDDVQRAMALVTQEGTTSAEFIKAISYLSYSAQESVKIARSRGERLVPGEETSAD